MSKWPGVAMALILLFGLAGCARTRHAAPPSPAAQQAAQTAALAASERNTPASRGAPSPPAQAAAAPSDSKRTVTLSQEQPSSATPAPTVAVRQNADVTSLLPLARDSRRLPQDFKIGALGDSRAGDADEQQAMATANSFLTHLVGGKVDETLLAADAGGRISGMLDAAVQRGDVAQEYRIGAPKKHENGEVTANVRLLGQVGTSEGEIAVARTGGHWLVTDLQISMDDLRVKREKSKERFFPSSYRWMLGE